MKIPDHAKKVFSGITFDVYHWELEDFLGKPIIWEGIKGKPGATLFVQTEEGKWLLQDEERPNGQKFTAMPGGHIDKGETPLEGAKRELLEETGMTGDFTHIVTDYVPLPKTELTVDYFLVTNAKKVEEPKLDGGERITPFFYDKEEFLTKIQEKGFGNPRAKLFIDHIKDV